MFDMIHSHGVATIATLSTFSDPFLQKKFAQIVLFSQIWGGYD